jgi:predicted P-loop ATPase
VRVLHPVASAPDPEPEPEPPPPPKPRPSRKPTLTVVEGNTARVIEPAVNPGYWQTKPWAEHIIITDKGAAKPCFANAVAAIRHDAMWAGVIGYDQFSMRSHVMRDNQFGLPIGPWSDAYDYVATEWLQRLGIVVTPQTVTAAVEAVAHEHGFNPLQDYLNGLEWDGTSRVYHWLADFCGADNNEYTQAVGSKWLIGAVARAMQPGCKVDTALVFEGNQGRGKSTVFSILGGKWFSDDIPELHGKAAAEAVGGIWILEIAELAAMNRSEIENVKAFITRRIDRFRPAYGRRVMECPRTSIFCGTSNGNGTGYLKDDENRRFWPVLTRDIDLHGLSAVRDQLWAEAVHLYRTGESWWISGAVVDHARVEQEARRQSDAWEEIIRQYINEKPYYDTFSSEMLWQARSEPLQKATVSDVLENALRIPVGRWTRADQMRVSACFKALGWERKKQNDGSWAYKPVRQGFHWIAENE